MASAMPQTTEPPNDGRIAGGEVLGSVTLHPSIVLAFPIGGCNVCCTMPPMGGMSPAPVQGRARPNNPGRLPGGDPDLSPLMETVSINRVALPGAARFWGRGPVPQRAVWPCGVVGLPPSLDQNLGLQQCVEQLSSQQLVTKPAIEALHVPVLPR